MMNDDYPENDQRSAVCQTQWEDNKAQRGAERKSFQGATLKEDKPGLFVARIATLNCIDSDSDVTVPGAFPDGKEILLSAYQHGSWGGGLPVGKALIHEVGNEVLIEGEFNLKTTGGRDTYETVKFAPSLQEWSYGFKVQSCDTNVEFEGQPVQRILKKLDVIEASPVLRGAGVNTAVLAIKGEGMSFINQLEAVLAAVKSMTERTKALAALRSNEGRKLSAANLDRMRVLLEDINKMSSEMHSIAVVMEPDTTKAIDQIAMRIIERQIQMRGN